MFLRGEQFREPRRWSIRKIIYTLLTNEIEQPERYGLIRDVILRLYTGQIRESVENRYARRYMTILHTTAATKSAVVAPKTASTVKIAPKRATATVITEGCRVSRSRWRRCSCFSSACVRGRCIGYRWMSERHREMALRLPSVRSCW